MSWFRRKVKEPATIESVSLTGRKCLSDVQAAMDRCSASQGKELAAAWRELSRVANESVDALADVVEDEPKDSRLRRAAQLVEDEIWAMTRPWLNLNFVVTHRVRLSTEEMSNLQRRSWQRAEELISACRDASGDELPAAQARLRQFVDELQLIRDVPSDVMTERQHSMWQLAVEEITLFAADALARPHPTP